MSRSIQTHGFVNPILADDAGEIIAGHGRYEAAPRLGLEQVPVIVLSHLTEAEKRAYRIADNRLAEVGSRWSVEMLRVEVDTIMELDASFDISLTGFDATDLELRFDVADSKQEQSDPVIPDVQPTAVTQLGDIWQIGEHRLICGDATRRETYAALLGRERVAMMIGDPPFNVKINGHVSGKGKNRHREFVSGSGEMTDAKFRQFLLAFMTQSAAFSKAGALHYVFMDWAHLPHLLAADSVRRRARLIELDPLYCDVIVRRSEEALGIAATLASSGRSFAEIADERAVHHG